MRQLTAELMIDAPAARVWEVIGPGFARIGEWASIIPASEAVPGTPGSVCPGGAPVEGRVCATGIRLLPRVTERLIVYDKATRTLTYKARDMPAFVTLARNTWAVIPAEENRCRVTLKAQYHYLRHGIPSPASSAGFPAHQARRRSRVANRGRRRECCPL